MKKVTQGKRKVWLRLLYVPRNDDIDVADFLLNARAKGENITQLLTNAIRLYMKEVTK